MKTFRVTLVVDGKRQLMIIAAKNEKQVEKRVEKFFRNMEYDNGFIDKIERID